MNKLKGAIGITNKTEDNKYIPFFDYDHDDLPDIFLDIAYFTKQYKLSNAFIISSTHGYNVFFLDKLSFSDCLDMCKKSMNIDKNFTKYSELKNNFTLRIGKDKKFYRMIPSYYNVFELSYAHYDFFNQFFNIDILNGIQTTDLKFDSYQEIQLVIFLSKKYGYIEVD